MKTHKSVTDTPRIDETFCLSDHIMNEKRAPFKSLLVFSVLLALTGRSHHKWKKNVNTDAASAFSLDRSFEMKVFNVDWENGGAKDRTWCCEWEFIDIENMLLWKFYWIVSRKAGGGTSLILDQNKEWCRTWKLFDVQHKFSATWFSLSCHILKIGYCR